MFAPTKTWRRWHRKINISQKRYAVASALAASAVPALVMARGHKIDDVPEIPLVIENELESKKKTSEAKDILSAIGALADVEKAADSKKIRAGKGKARNRKYVLRRGPLIIYKTNDGVVHSATFPESNSAASTVLTYCSSRRVGTWADSASGVRRLLTN
jgi:large subunit ribosomal protein L4e